MRKIIVSFTAGFLSGSVLLLCGVSVMNGLYWIAQISFTILVLYFYDILDKVSKNPGVEINYTTCNKED